MGRRRVFFFNFLSSSVLQRRHSYTHLKSLSITVSLSEATVAMWAMALAWARATRIYLHVLHISIFQFFPLSLLAVKSFCQADSSCLKALNFGTSPSSNSVEVEGDRHWLSQPAKPIPPIQRDAVDHITMYCIPQDLDSQLSSESVSVFHTLTMLLTTF